MQDTRDHILSEAGKLLSSIGPSSMTMDMIARNCGISKRTLYEKFPDKRSLIMQCVVLNQQRHEAEFKAIFDSAANCFEALFKIYGKVRSYLQDTSMAFVEDIKRMYPEIHTAHQRNQETLVGNLADILVKAQAEGHVLPDIDPRIAAFLFLTTMHSLHESEAIARFGFDKVRVYDGAFLNFLRGMATADGIAYIDSQVAQLRSRPIRLNNTL